ncbi:MAG: isoleucine--tRNA ligase [Deltaproteobacteria bacterium]|nr:isoleucine--tRNA ligase [Deltaproteobacteria bacterium]
MADPIFDKVPSQIDFPADERRVLDFWKERDIFARTLEKNRGKPSFVFYEGPPTANGTPHNGHVLTRVIKDLFPRYKTMRGFDVPRKAGWDTHGLPVEVEVEKELGIHGKEAIEAYGVEAFTQKCIASVFRYTDAWQQLTRRIGFWVDLEDAYVTYHQSYVESVWWALSELFKKGLLYQGHKVVWWWPQGGTALSAGEVGLGYKTVDDPAIVVRFRLADNAGTSLLAWTTTPWTLPSNCALAVHPDIEYAEVRRPVGEGEDAGYETVVLARALVAQVFPTPKDGTPPEVVRTFKGADLVGLRYLPAFDFATPEGGDPWRVIPADFVAVDSGTGIVHVAPAYGVDDFNAGKANGVGFLQLVGADGKFDDRAGELAGRFCKEADKDLTRDLDRRGLVVSKGTYRHDYPFCWRADNDPLIQFARPAWFIRTTSVTAEAIANNRTIDWIPEHIKEGRFGDWLANNVDWALSRERYWGTPLPLWVCKGCGHTVAMSKAADIEARNPRAFEAFEAARRADPTLSEHLKVHKPWIDDVTIPCEACGAPEVRRVPEVIDCWFDSGCMPFAQWGWPHAGHAQFERAFPADFISEAVDQTRGWFYSLVMISTLLFGDRFRSAGGGPHPFKTCIVLGHVTDKHGKKESKSKGNYTPPDKILDTDGADAMRWYFYASNPPWNNTRYSPESVRLGQQEFLVKLRNVYAFFTIYANIDQFHPGAPTDPTRAARPVAERAELDRWILSEVALALADVTRHMDAYRLYDAAQRIIRLTDGLSNWYVRRSRDRFWAGAGDPSKWDAYHTLYEALVTITLMAAPFVPFITETLWQNLVRRVDPAAPESVHLADWPEPVMAHVDERLSADMQAVRDVVALGLQARNANRLKVRQPLGKAEVVVGHAADLERLARHKDLIADELNVKEVVLSFESPHVSYALKPDFRALGPVYGARVQLVKRALEAADAARVRTALATEGKVVMPLADGTEAELTSELVKVAVTPAAGFVASAGSVGVVILDATITPALLAEGRAREVLSRIQAWRKQADLDFTARIEVTIGGDPALVEACRAHEGFIASEALATRVTFDEPNGAVVDADVDGLPLRLGLR